MASIRYFLQSPKQNLRNNNTTSSPTFAVGGIWIGTVVQTVIQDLHEKPSVSNGLCQRIYIRCGNNTHICFLHFLTITLKFTALRAHATTCLGGKGNSPTSSRKIVPPSASPKYPLRSPIAPVKAPFMSKQFRVDCPFGNGAAVHGNVLSMLAPAILVNYLRKLSLSHTTLSGNRVRTSRWGATWIAISMARISASLLPIMPENVILLVVFPLFCHSTNLLLHYRVSVCRYRHVSRNIAFSADLHVRPFTLPVTEPSIATYTAAEKESSKPITYRRYHRLFHEPERYVPPEVRQYSSLPSIANALNGANPDRDIWPAHHQNGKSYPGSRKPVCRIRSVAEHSFSSHFVE